jgi:hypothetical protein
MSASADTLVRVKKLVVEYFSPVIRQMRMVVSVLVPNAASPKARFTFSDGFFSIRCLHPSRN